MKRFFALFIILATLLPAMQSCITYPPVPTDAEGKKLPRHVSEKDNLIKIESLEYRGHLYIMLYARNITYASPQFLHDPDCPCQKKGTGDLGEMTNGLDGKSKMKEFQNLVTKKEFNLLE